MPFVSFHNMSLIRAMGAVNSDYHWESIRKIDVGLEFGFFNDRVITTATWYRSRAGDQLGNYPLPATSGALDITKNQDARIQNSGWEFSIMAKIAESKNFGWTITANHGILKDKVLFLPDVIYNGYGISRHVGVGKRFSGFALVYKYAGLNTATGLYQFQQLDGNTSTDPDNSNWDELVIDTRPKTIGYTS
jgi:TonB-dependent starch-binding outer membrane protein SusC